MEPQPRPSPIPSLFFLLLLLVHFHGCHTRQLPALHVNNQDHFTTMLFFHQRDLKSGNTIPLYFHPTTNPKKTPKFLPKQISDSLPFSLSHLPYLLKTLQIPSNSTQSTSMAESLAHCEKPPLTGESKFCATSLESMLDFITAQFGPQSDPKLITTSSRVGYRAPQTFKMLKDPTEMGAPDMIACHPVPFPYAVMYCHGQRGVSKLYEMEMETEREGKQIRVRVLSMCHMDTSDWDPNHVAFGLLGIRPGEEPVCHAFPPDSLIWIPRRRPGAATKLENVV